MSNNVVVPNFDDTPAGIAERERFSIAAEQMNLTEEGYAIYLELSDRLRVNNEPVAETLYHRCMETCAQTRLDMSTLSSEGSDSDDNVLLKSRASGRVGNTTSVKFVAAAPNQVLGATVVGRDFTITLQTGGSPATVETTLEQFCAFINSNKDTKELLRADLLSGVDGTQLIDTIPTPGTKIFLTGGEQVISFNPNPNK